MGEIKKEEELGTMTERKARMKARRDQEFTRDVKTGAVIRWAPMIDWKARRRASILEKRRIDDLKRKKEEADSEKKYKDKEADSEKKYKDGEADSETKKYEVFLSFSEDTRYNFVGYLYEALIQKGIHTFKDDENLDRGKHASPELLKAIEESRFAIVIISIHYASSTWCLEELAQIIHCKNEMGMAVLPVFYHVDPSEVRKQMGTFRQAFIEHEAKLNKERVEKWRYALTEVGNLAGCRLNKTR